jgi:hypothetical protein
MIKQTHKLTVKKLNHLTSLSEETYCFSAYVYVDNKVIGKASNLGQGGSTDFHPNEDGQAYLTNIVGRSRLIELIDDAVHAAITEKSQAKELKKIRKHMLKAVLFINDISEGLHSYRYVSLKGKPVLTEAQQASIIDGLKKKYAEPLILNGKSDAELLQLLAI